MSAHAADWIEVPRGAYDGRRVLMDAQSIAHEGRLTSALFRAAGPAAPVRHVGDCVARTISGPIATAGPAPRSFLPASSGTLGGDMLHAMCQAKKPARRRTGS